MRSSATGVAGPIDPEVTAATRGGSAHILVVEDEHLVALDIKNRLDRLGYAAELVHSGEAALDRAVNREFDLVLMDIKLKGALDGIETARRLRARYEVPIIYLTAYADDTTLARARSTEPYGYVLKPFHERELKAAVEMALQKSHADRVRREQNAEQRFLADASARLASSLDYLAVARGAAELVVPRTADWCAIHLVGAPPSRPDVTYSYPGETRTSNGNGSTGTLIHAVETSRRAELIAELGPNDDVGRRVGIRHRERLKEQGVHSLICVPLIARDHVLGSMALAASRKRAAFQAIDLVAAEDLAHRLALALDNALLYRTAEQAIRMRDDVLAIVSHDLRAPLGAIVLQAELLASRPGVGEAATNITRSARTMNRLLGDLLDASAINAGQLTLDLDSHSVDEIMREVHEMFHSQSEARGIELREELLHDGSLVRCDRDRIVQVLSNLVGNALKFTRRGGTVTLRLVHREMDVRFEVDDTGEGMPAEEVPHLFDRFWRGQRRHTGTGLGLFIVRGILSAHGSSIDVETSLGSGSRFFFHLPLVSS